MIKNDIERTKHYTVNAELICKGLTDFIPEDATLVEPFVGKGDLLSLFPENKWELYDIEPQIPNTFQQDTLRKPPDYKGKWVITNPPFLAKNKATDKTIFNMYEGYDDLYKIKVHFGTINEVLIKNEGEYALTTYYRFLGSLDEICNILGIMKNSSNGCVSNSSIYCFYLIEKVLNDKPILEKTFSWLKNDNNSTLRIDAYFEKYNLAIEYNGIQHYECCEFCKTDEELNNRIKNDNIKKKLCKENGIKLISIKYTEKLTIDNIKNLLIKNNIIERN